MKRFFNTGTKFFVLGALSALTLNAQFASAAEKKVIRMALTEEPPQLNSSKATDTASGFVLGHVKEGLMRYGKSGDVIAGVAEKWELTDKGATFYLRKTAKWSDGQPVTAKDFIFSWRLAIDPKNASEYAFFLYPIKNAEAINKGKMAPTELGAKATDDHTIKIEFEKPCGYFLGVTAFPTLLPIREDFYTARKGKYGANTEDLLYNGPFMITQWVHGASLRMEKNPHYWNTKEVKIDVIDSPYITNDNNTRFNFFKENKIDFVGLQKDDLQKALKEGFKMQSFNDGSVWYLEYNFREGRVTRNKALREAIALVFNQTEYMNTVIGIPGTVPGSGIVPRWVKGVSKEFRKEFPIPARKVNLAEAKKKMAQAMKELNLTTPPTLIWLTGDSPLASKEAEYFQNLLKKNLGIELKIDKQIFKQRLAKMTSGEFDIVAAGWGPDYADPMTFADLKTSWNENNRGKWSNAEFDRHIREAQATSDQKKRMASMAAAEKILIEDLGLMPTYERVIKWTARDHIQGIVRNPIGPDPYFAFASMK